MLTRLLLILYVPFALVVLAVSAVAFFVACCVGFARHRRWKATFGQFGRAMADVTHAVLMYGLDLWEGAR